MRAGERPLGHVSIHDVAPETLGAVGEGLERLREAGAGRVMLLVIPGLGWTEAEVGRLREWAAAGHVLAAHGWVHRVARRRTLVHQVHGRLISRHVAEHLSWTAEEIGAHMQRGCRWFAEQGLPVPSHYVPPAWALGRIGAAALRGLPYATVETLGGVRVVASGRFVRMPLLGYEADTALRAAFLRGFNRWNLAAAGRAVMTRIAVHPHDFGYRLGDAIVADCRRFRLRATFGDVIGEAE